MRDKLWVAQASLVQKHYCVYTQRLNFSTTPSKSYEWDDAFTFSEDSICRMLLTRAQLLSCCCSPLVVPSCILLVETGTTHPLLGALPLWGAPGPVGP